MLEDLIDKGLLIGQYDLVVAQGGDGVEKGLPVAAGVGGIVRFEARFLDGIVDIVGWIEGTFFPMFSAVVKAVPHFYLDDDVALGGPAQKVGKALPIRRIPAVEVVLAVGPWWKAGIS